MLIKDGMEQWLAAQESGLSRVSPVGRGFPEVGEHLSAYWFIAARTVKK